MIFSTSQLRNQQRIGLCTENFWKCLHRTADASMLYCQLSKSLEQDAHVSQLLAGWQDLHQGKLERYLPNISLFLDFQLSEGNSTAEVSPGLLADYLYSAQRSVAQDRGLHRTSPLMCVKSLRWWAKHASWPALTTALQSTLVSAYAKQTNIKDKREAVPIPLAAIAAWERAVCSKHSLSGSS